MIHFILKFVMRKSNAFILVCFVLLPFLSVSQELSYTHYDTKDGLAGSTVYCTTLDKDGFLWFGTENGLSRFDGTHFKNFTTRDGLPDNEILELFTDSKGRIWMAPFRNTVCYYYKGKIYTQQNDSLLAPIKLKVNILHFAEDKKGNILLNEFSGTRMHLIKTNGTVTVLDNINGVPITSSASISVNQNGNFCFLEKDNLYEIKDKEIALIDHFDSFDWHLSYRHTLLSKKIAGIRRSFELEIKNFSSDKSVKVPFPPTFLKFSIIKDTLLGVCKQSGIIIYNTENFAHVTYLEGKPVTSSITDQEGSLWFTTFGQGIYRLNSRLINNIILPGENVLRQAVTSIFKRLGKLVIGTQVSTLYELYLENSSVKISKERYLYGRETTSDIMDFRALTNGDNIFFGTQEILKMSNKFIPKKAITVPNKFISDINKNELLVGTSYNALIFDPYTFKIKDTIWKQRATSVFYRNDTFFIGALDGLYLIKKDKSVIYLGSSIPAFKSRIASIKEASDGTIWIATYGDGILAYKNHTIITHLTTDNGLTSNICRNIFINGTDLWVGTDKGLNKVDYSKKNFPVIQYTTSDGLASNIINTVFVDKNIVYIGTREGLTYFDEKKLSQNSRCDLRITGITIAGQSYPTDTMNISIPHKKNNLQFEFVGISYRSAGDITYRYRLIGLDSSWQTTKETFLNYPTLPSGNYELQLQAINKFGIASSIIAIPFGIEKLFWEKTWFKLLVASAIAILVWLLLNLRIRFIRRQESEKQRIATRITELEQLALKSQMNPHFIFNSLNSIQQYVIDKDIAGANKFISGFSRLMRQTMYFSSKSYISVSDELNYLSTYLELEKDRLENVFIYKITVEENIYPQNYLIPPMILQPYVENSVRHGVRYRKDKEGVILINVSRHKNYLTFVIEDNGIGRKKSQQLKGNTSIEYQSKGMSLTGDRIKMLNEKSGSKIEVLIDDMENTEGQPLGTKVIVRFPLIEN